MTEIKFTYFDLRVKGEAARLLLAYSGLKWEDDRVVLPWDDFEVWKKMKPTMPWGQLPCLTWNGERLCQSMSICRFLAREIGVAGRNSMEMAQVDELLMSSKMPFMQITKPGMRRIDERSWSQSQEKLFQLLCVNLRRSYPREKDSLWWETILPGQIFICFSFVQRTL